MTEIVNPQFHHSFLKMQYNLDYDKIISSSDPSLLQILWTSSDPNLQILQPRHNILHIPDSRSCSQVLVADVNTLLQISRQTGHHDISVLSTHLWWKKFLCHLNKSIPHIPWSSVFRAKQIDQFLQCDL